MYVKVKSEHKYLLKLVLSGIHLKIIGVYAIKCLVIKLCEDFLAFHTSFIRVLGDIYLVDIKISRFALCEPAFVCKNGYKTYRRRCDYGEETTRTRTLNAAG